MAHKLIGNKVVVDWTTGDPERSRITVLSAYRDFIKQVYDATISMDGRMDLSDSIKALFEKWQIDTENQIDEVPRTWIHRPE